MSYIHNTIQIELEREYWQNTWEWETRREGGPKLHPSTVGYCRRKAILTAYQAFPDHTLSVLPEQPDIYVMGVMRSGNVWEDANAKYILQSFPGTIHGYKLDTEYWRGEIDFLLPNGTIVEHKDTAEYNFKAKDRLPYKHHVCQTITYWFLLGELRGKDPPMPRIYYNGRGHWAEFELWPVSLEETAGAEWTVHQDGSTGWEPHQVQYTGQVDGDYRDGTIEVDIPIEMAVLETYLQQGELPPTPGSPLLIKEWGHCIKRRGRNGYSPACPWFAYCWPTWPTDYITEDMEADYGSSGTSSEDGTPLRSSIAPPAPGN